MEELKQQVLDLTRQFSALQRQLQMQGEVSHVAASLEGRLDEVASACERRAAEADEALSSRVADVSRDLGELRGELGLRARAEDLQQLAEEVRCLKEAEQRLWEEVQPKIKSDPLDGIIARLTHEYGGNVHKEGLVKVTASSCGYGQPENVVDLKSDSDFHTSNSPTPSWICYDFKGRRVTPTSYSIRSYDNGPGSYHPKSWALEVSNDGSEGPWEIVDFRENNFDLNGCYFTRNFAISDPPSGSFRFFRLRQTGKSHQGNDILVICALELFGTLSSE